MGIGYVDSIVLYNRYVTGPLEEEVYVGTRFNRVRVELTQGAVIRTTGNERADSCVVKIPDRELPKPYAAPRVWLGFTEEEKNSSFTIDRENKNFFVICKKAELGIDLSVPEGVVKSAAYPAGFYQYIRERYGYAYPVKTVDIYQLIPRFEIGGA